MQKRETKVRQHGEQKMQQDFERRQRKHNLARLQEQRYKRGLMTTPLAEAFKGIT